MVSLPTSTSWPFHHPMFSDFFNKLSPIQPEIGITGVLFSTKSFFPAHLHQHALHLVANLIIPGLLVAGSVAVHLVHTNADLLHTQQVDQTGVLTSLSLDLTSLVVALGNGSGEVTISWHHDQSHIGLGGPGNHVLDEVTMAWGINDGVVPLLGEELLGGACNGHTTLTLLLLPVHEEGECERALAQTLSLSLQLLQITLRQATQLKDQAASGSALTTCRHGRKSQWKGEASRSWQAWLQVIFSISSIVEGLNKATAAAQEAVVFSLPCEQWLHDHILIDSKLCFPESSLFKVYFLFHNTKKKTQQQPQQQNTKKRSQNWNLKQHDFCILLWLKGLQCAWSVMRF